MSKLDRLPHHIRGDWRRHVQQVDTHLVDVGGVVHVRGVLHVHAERVVVPHEAGTLKSIRAGALKSLDDLIKVILIILFFDLVERKPGPEGLLFRLLQHELQPRLLLPLLSFR